MSAVTKFFRRHEVKVAPLPTSSMIAAPGLQCGFGDFLGIDLLNDIHKQGFAIIRLDLQISNPQLTHDLAQEVIDIGMQPLCIIRRAEQLDYLPPGSLAELGNEPDISQFGWTLDSYVAECRRAVPIARDSGTKLYIGVVSNLNKRGFNFLERIPWNEFPSASCSIHRYPDGDSPLNSHSGCSSREDEIIKLRKIVGNRSMAVTEVGYHDGEGGWPEQTVATNMAWERRFFSQQGFEIVVGFQLNDGPNTDTESHFGFRRLDGIWKPVSRAFIESVN